jgi:hypothetical protein
MMKLKKNKNKRVNIKGVTIAAVIPTLSMALLLSAFLFVGAGCAGSPKVKTEAEKGSEDYIFYPPLPNNPRYQYLTSFSTSKDIEKKKGKFFKFIVGEKVEKVLPIRKAYGVDMHKGIIYVCDVRGTAVITIDLNERKFGLLGDRGRGKLLKPINLFLDRENSHLYVADVFRKQVICYTLSGKFVKTYGKKDQFIKPVDVELHGDKLFVCDVGRHQVLVLDKEEGNTLYTIGKAGSKEGELFHPTNIRIHDNRLYVSETTNFRVQIFDLEGKSLAIFGGIGKRPGTFSRNKGIDIDKEGRIYVVESQYDKLQVFDQDYKLLLYFLDPGLEKHNIYLSAGVAVVYDNLEYFKDYISPNFDAEYLVIVTSHFGNNKVNVYAFGTYHK